MSAPTWNLEPIYPGGLQGEAFTSASARLREDVEELIRRADALPPLPADLDAWSRTLCEFAALDDLAQEIGTFVACHACADTADTVAVREDERVRSVRVRLDRAWVPLADGLAHAAEEAFEALTARSELADWLPLLRSVRARAQLLLPRAEGSLAAELARDGIEAWSQLYDRVSGKLQVVLDDGRTVSVTRAQNLLASPEAATRTGAQGALDRAWSSVEDTCAAALTHVVGSRQVLNDRRGVDELADGLARFRMRRETLDALMEAARRSIPACQRYLALKARLIGKDALGWEDQWAPLASDTSASMTWAEAADFVVTHFGAFHGELADFARRALDERWVEAEDREGKRPGGWCATLPISGQARVFMTFGGSFRSMMTLAHELGHAYHAWVCRDLPQPRRHVPSTLAETASVMAETIVRDASLEAAGSKEERLALLDARLQAALTFLMNIPARYSFERELYRLRRQGPLVPDELSEVMVACQREAYGDSLSSWHPRFWAGKLHFYIARFAFYNYPYTFGYAFSALVQARAQAEGPAFHGQYVDLLRRTGWQDAEDLAREILGIDLTDPDAWAEGLAPLEADLAALEREIG